MIFVWGFFTPSSSFIREFVCAFETFPSWLMTFLFLVVKSRLPSEPGVLPRDSVSSISPGRSLSLVRLKFRILFRLTLGLSIILWGLSSKGIALAPSSSSSRCLPVMLSLTLWGKEDSCSRNSFIHGCSIAYFAESLYSGSNSIQH